MTTLQQPPTGTQDTGRAVTLLGLATTLAAALTYLGAVSATGWIVFVLPAILLSSAVATRTARRAGLLQGIALGALTAIGWAVAVKVSGYSMGGSVARSPLFAGPLAAVAMAALARYRVGWFSAAIAAIPLAGWTISGAEYHAAVITATIVLIMLTVTLAEHRRRRWVSGGNRPGAWLAIAVVGAAGGATAYSLIPRDVEDQEVDQAETMADAILDKVRLLAVDPWLVVLCLVVVVLLLAWAARLLLRRRAAARLRAQLSGQSPAQSVQNAWVWTVHSVRRAGRSVPADLAPDEPSRLVAELPGSASDEARRLAAMATRAAFTPEPGLTERDAEVAWQDAERVISLVRAAQPLAKRLALR